MRSRRPIRTSRTSAASWNSRSSCRRSPTEIHATSNVDEIMLELGQDICSLVGADRLTIYVMSDDRYSIISKVKTGLTSFKDLKLPINDQSIAGFVGAEPQYDQYPRRLRRERAAQPQPATALPEGSGQAYRLSHQADAGGPGGRGRVQRADRRSAGDQHEERPAVPAARGGGDRQSVRDPRDRLQAAAEAAGDGARQV